MKITEPGKEFVGDRYEEGTPYPGAKPWMYIPEEMFDDREWLSGLLRATADALPGFKTEESDCATIALQICLNENQN